ncbi:uncharacterized protein LOC144118228 [Amblyomma americanum]
MHGLAADVKSSYPQSLACPIGSLVAGPKDFIEKVARVRKCLGEGMRQAEIIATAGLVLLRTIVPRLHEGHEKTQRLARGVSLKDNAYISIDLDTMQTNMVTEREYEDPQQAIIVKMLPIISSQARAVLYNDVNADDVDADVVKIRYVIDELCRSVDA